MENCPWTRRAVKALCVMLLAGSVAHARAEGRYVVKPNSEGGFIELSDKKSPPDLLVLAPECKGAWLAKSYAPGKMNLYGCWWRGHAGMITVRWFDPYAGATNYTYDAADFRVLNSKETTR